jgi:large subunit ribosomal protein L23
MITKTNLYNKIISPIVTEKSTNQSEQNKKIFKVDVIKINIVNKKSKTKSTRGKKVTVPGYKKAIVTLKKGQNIDLTTGI